MKQILCVVDLTGSSAKVLDVAARIAAACGAHLSILYPYRLISNDHRGNMTSLKRKIESEAKEKFDKLKEEIPGLALADHDFHSEIGFMSDRICANADSTVNMVIIGQEQADSSNDIRSFNLQQMIRSLQLPFVIVPTDVRVKAGV